MPVDPGVAIHVYRVLQEALSNVARHSGTTEAIVRLAFRDGALHLEVEDHGSGLTPGAGPRGLGLVAMRERAELVGGRVTISRPPAGGTAGVARGAVVTDAAAGSPAAGRITVLLADDHALVRRGFRRLLEDDPDLAVVGEASNGDEAIAPRRQPRAARHRDGRRHAGHERAGRHPRHPRAAARRRAS